MKKYKLELIVELPNDITQSNVYDALSDTLLHDLGGQLIDSKSLVRIADHDTAQIPYASAVKNKIYEDSEEKYKDDIIEIVKRINQATQYSRTTVFLGNVHVNDFIRDKFRAKGYVFTMDIHPTTGIRNCEVIDLSKTLNN